jgi:hypothetical protein
MTLAKRLTGKALPLGQFTQLVQLLHAHMSAEENVLFWYLDVQGRSEQSSP